MAHRTAPTSLRSLRRQSGQAMLEYSAVTWFMLGALGTPLLLTFGPNFLKAYDIYLKGLYIVLNLALP